MIPALLTALGISLALTLVLETGFFLITCKRDRKDLLLVVMVNILTNPVVVLIYWLAVVRAGWNMIMVLAPLEVSAVLIEGYYYKKYGRCFKRPYFFSLFANAFSYFSGLLLQMFIF